MKEKIYACHSKEKNPSLAIAFSDLKEGGGVFKKKIEGTSQN